MKVIAITLAIAIAATLAGPAAAQQVRGIDGAIAHFNRSIDSPNQRIRPQSSRLQRFTRSTRSPRRLSRAARTAIRINNDSAETSTERRILRGGRVGNQGFSTQRDGLSRRQRLALDINNRSAESSTERRVIVRR
ncbi:MAG: hypothetical protein AAGE03_08840 [Pseudomonadota bacterium]